MPARPWSLIIRCFTCWWALRWQNGAMGLLYAAQSFSKPPDKPAKLGPSSVNRKSFYSMSFSQFWIRTSLSFRRVVVLRFSLSSSFLEDLNGEESGGRNVRRDSCRDVGFNGFPWQCIWLELQVRPALWLNAVPAIRHAVCAIPWCLSSLGCLLSSMGIVLTHWIPWAGMADGSSLFCSSIYRLLQSLGAMVGLFGFWSKIIQMYLKGDW